MAFPRLPVAVALGSSWAPALILVVPIGSYPYIVFNFSSEHWDSHTIVALTVGLTGMWIGAIPISLAFWLVCRQVGWLAALPVLVLSVVLAIFLALSVLSVGDILRREPLFEPMFQWNELAGLALMMSSMLALGSLPLWAHYVISKPGVIQGASE